MKIIQSIIGFFTFATVSVISVFNPSYKITPTPTPTPVKKIILSPTISPTPIPAPSQRSLKASTELYSYLSEREREEFRKNYGLIFIDKELLKDLTTTILDNSGKKIKVKSTEMYKYEELLKQVSINNFAVLLDKDSTKLLTVEREINNYENSESDTDYNQKQDLIIIPTKITVTLPPQNKALNPTNTTFNTIDNYQILLNIIPTYTYQYPTPTAINNDDFTTTNDCSGVENTISNIKNSFQSLIDSQTLTTSNEMGKRGILPSSGLFQTELQNALQPIYSQMNYQIAQYCLQIFSINSCPCP